MEYKETIIIVFVFSFTLLISSSYAATPFFANGGLTENGIEWCEENYQLYQFMGIDFFEHHKHSIESRICVSLYYDPLWTYSGHDRYEKLVEQSRIYAELERKESLEEADSGIIDIKPVTIEEIPQEIEQQQKELELKSDMKVVSNKTMIESEIEKKELENSKGGGCLIATATYGTELAPQVQLLRELRDHKLLNTESGQSFMNGFNSFYYSFSPTIADWERQNPIFQEIVRAFITPMISTLAIMTLVDGGSEIEIIGLGISVIALNLGMYVATPTIVLWQVRKRT